MESIIKPLNTTETSNTPKAIETTFNSSAGLFGWNGVTIAMMVLLTIVCLVMYVIIFQHRDVFPQWANDLFETVFNTCPARCGPDCNSIANKFRDETYFVEPEYKGTNKNCVITTWEITHLIMHVFLGYFYNIYISVALNIGFEIYEHYKFDCGNYLDVFYNTLGFFIGYGLRGRFSPD